jgi:hypothetical protein
VSFPPEMPGTDRDRAVALGVMMCLQRERQWHFTLRSGRLWIESTLTLGIRPLAKLQRLFRRYVAHEVMVLHHFCDALSMHIARADVERIRKSVPSEVAPGNLDAHETSMRRFLDVVNDILVLYDLPAISADALDAPLDVPVTLKLAAVLPPWNRVAVRRAHAWRRYVEVRSLLLRTELAQRLAELRWTLLEADEDGTTRVG